MLSIVTTSLIRIDIKINIIACLCKISREILHSQIQIGTVTFCIHSDLSLLQKNIMLIPVIQLSVQNRNRVTFCRNILHQPKMLLTGLYIIPISTVITIGIIHGVPCAFKPFILPHKNKSSGAIRFLDIPKHTDQHFALLLCSHRTLIKSGQWIKVSFSFVIFVTFVLSLSLYDDFLAIPQPVRNAIIITPTMI